ncbi:hypothetical protein Y032_0013g1942 [Ancylostoma ceylanicum]|uniref:Uncharacterized protein n=3 Tax=Ancylostoma ceylanicum TaxID=53326 RepID=A0A016VBX4_9BILA|nr:hypothetical protein Y032_0013g1942 [Ancylostoma ceylanicum]
MSVTSFLRRLSADSDSPKSSRSSRESRDSRDSPRHATSRRSRLVASIDSARRRFSLQHCNDVYHHLQAVAMMRDPQRLDVGSLPDLQEKPRSPQAKRVSVVAGGDRMIYVHKNRKNPVSLKESTSKTSLLHCHGSPCNAGFNETLITQTNCGCDD